MADVARLAGVSAMTVSRALRRESSVSEQTRARVLEVVDEIGYVPDQAAGALSSGRSGLVAAIMPTLTVPMFAHVARGLSETLSQAGLELFLGSSDYSASREEEILRAILRRRPEAVMLTGVDHTGKSARLLANAGIPVIEFLDGSDPPIDNIIGLDLPAIARATIEFLKAKSRTKLGVVISRDQTDRRSEAWVRGLQAAAKQLGVPDPIVLRHGAASNPVELGARGAGAAIREKLDVDALIFMNDYAAIGALGALKRLGVKTPDDIAVFGFGDCEVASAIDPALTTVSFNPIAAGVEIGKVVLSALESVKLGQPRRPYKLVLDFQIVARDSA